MKKREQKSIIVWFVLSLVIFVVSMVFILVNVYPNILEIEAKKLELTNKHNEYTKLLWKWLPFTQFTALSKSNSFNTNDETIKSLLKDPYYVNIFPKIDDLLYDKTIYYEVTEDWNNEMVWYSSFKPVENFSSHLIDVSKIIKEKSKESAILNKQKDIENVLPIYGSMSVEKGLTDLWFINYIEWLLDKFNLSTTSQIWVKAIKNEIEGILKKDTWMYYIPLSLDLSWTKSSLLNFLEFIKNTWSIVINGDDFEFSNKFWSTYQLSEVEDIEFTDYIDSSHKPRGLIDDSLLRFFYKTNQSQDIIDIKLSLKFYVWSIGSKEMFDQINSIIWSINTKIIENNGDNDLADWEEEEYELIHYNHWNLVRIANTLKSNPYVNKSSYYKGKVEDIVFYLNSSNLKKDFVIIKKELKTTKNIESVYKKVLKYKDIFTKIDMQMYSIAKDLEIAIDEKDEDTWKVIEKSIYPDNYYFK